MDLQSRVQEEQQQHHFQRRPGHREAHHARAPRPGIRQVCVFERRVQQGEGIASTDPRPLEPKVRPWGPQHHT